MSDFVIKHRAPNGALRLVTVRACDHDVGVIKHRAPNGALRQDEIVNSNAALTHGHKAPSAKRRIKTR